MKLLTIAVLFSAVFGYTADAADVSSDVQRLQIERDRQQLDLRLKMQQQQERASRPSPDPFTQQRRGMLEREQVQRQQQSFDQERTLIAPPESDDAANAARLTIQRQEAERAAARQAQRFEMQRERE